MTKTIEELMAECRELARVRGRALERGDSKSANRNYDKLVRLVPLIRAFGDAGTAALITLTTDDDDAVACLAAIYTLPVDEERALALLEGLAAKRGIVAFTAKMCIEQWKKGEMKLP
jgi:hypothetical protein